VQREAQALCRELVLQPRDTLGQRPFDGQREIAELRSRRRSSGTDAKSVCNGARRMQAPIVNCVSRAARGRVERGARGSGCNG
jgi:hypothetical protein